MTSAPMTLIAGEAFSEPEVIAGFSLFKKLRNVVRKVARVLKKPIRAVTTFAKKVVRPVLQKAAPALGMASVAFPWLAPAALAANLANRVMTKAQQGQKTARAAMRLLGRGADRGDKAARGMMGIMKRLAQHRQRLPKTRLPRRPLPRMPLQGLAAFGRRLNAGTLRQLAALARRGNPQAAGTLQHIAGAAEAGDTACQQLLEEAAGQSRWVAPYDAYNSNGNTIQPSPWEAAGQAFEVAAGQDWEVTGDSNPSSVETYYGDYYDVVAGGPLWDYLKPQRPYRADDSQTFWGARDAYHDGLNAVPARG